jgi:large subunit ribosomal protein L22
MTGPKLNDGVLIAGDRPLTRATAKYLRGSAYKAREVLDLIRGLDVRRAEEVLQFTRRDVATEIRKVLASAVANAVHNDEQDADELFVVACYADEGPTLRRYRPRARGRATRIRKRTCHVTVVVARMSDEKLDIVQARQESHAAAGRRRAGVSARARRDRVERSRARAQGLRDVAETAVETAESEAPEEELDDTSADVDEVEAEEIEAEEAEETPVDEAPELPEGAVAAPDDGSIPEGYEIKGNANSMKYHVPGGRYYEATIGDVFFDTVEHAEAAGYEAPATDEAVIAEAVEAEATDPDAEAPELPEGAVAAPEDGSIPDGYEIKGNANSMKYHVPGGRYYDITIGDVFFDTAEHAEAAGYEAPAADTTEDED